jgi:homospermidine synthase
MAESQIYATVPGQLVIIGFGSIGQGTLPLILRHLDVKKDGITIICPDPQGQAIAEGYGVRFVQEALTLDNYRTLLTPLLTPGSFLLNLSVHVSSTALVKLCQELNVLYLDTCIEPWDGGYTDPTVSPAQRTNYMLREKALALRNQYPKGPTAVLAHGANPGLVSHLVKQALIQIATDIFGKVKPPQTRAEWGELMEKTGVKVIHIAERDTQIASVPKQRGEFVNTWSVKGFIGEGCQPAELGWGSHERHWPENAEKHVAGCGAAIYLNRPGASVRVRSWTPNEGPYHGFLITHNEAISIAD